MIQVRAISPYAAGRYWWLHELTRLRAALRVGTVAPASASRERAGIIRELAKLRRARE